MTWVVYGIHPVGRPNEPFYIGRTGNFYQRRSAHWKSQGSKVYERIQCLRANGIESEMTIISSHESPARAHQAECTLLRSTDGLVNRPISLGAIPIAISVIPSMERQIEEFRLKNGLPSRTAAIRELIERGLRRIVIALALVGTLVSQTGCAVLLTGYLIGEGMQRSKATETCRANLKATNDLRLKEGKDPFPDQCGQ